MKILVLGASQGTGALCVKAALAKGHSVTAFSRTPEKLDVTHPALTKVAGDFHDAASVRSAVAGHDAVIICASPSATRWCGPQPARSSRLVTTGVSPVQNSAAGEATTICMWCGVILSRAT